MFSAHIEILEESLLEERWSNQPTVLIAQSAVEDDLYAVERVQEGIYAICRLGNWVSVKMLERMQTIPIDSVRLQKRQHKEQPGLPGDKWWSTAAIGFRPEERYDQDEKRAVEKTRGLRLYLQRPQKKPTILAQITQEISQPVLEDQTGNLLTDLVEEAVQDPEEVLKLVRVQYQEALYASKVRHSSCTNIGHITDRIFSRRWHTLQKGHCPEYERLFIPPMALPTVSRI